MAWNPDTVTEKNKHGVEFKINEYPAQTTYMTWFCFHGNTEDRFDTEKQARDFAKDLK